MRRFIKEIGLILILFVAFILVSCEEAKPAGTLMGVVLDSETSVPIQGVFVSVNTNNDTTIDTTTDANGVYTISFIPIGDYIVSYSKTGYTTKSQKVKIRVFGNDDFVSVPDNVNGNTIDFGAAVYLEKTSTEYGKLTGSVIDDLTKEPISGVAVSINTNPAKNATTDANGVYSIADVPVGGYIVSFTKSSYVTSNKKVTIDVSRNGGTSDYNASLIRSNTAGFGRLTGAVVDSSGKPISDVNVSINDIAKAFSAVTDINGVYAIEEVPIGRYIVSYVKAGYTTGNEELNIYESGDQVTYNKTLSLAPIEITVSAGTAASPLLIKNPITLTFSKSIAKESFKASISIPGSTPYSSTEVPLVVAWTGDTTVDLRYSSGNSSSQYKKFPYSDDKGVPIGELKISGNAIDGTAIALSTTNVYTEEKIKLVDVDSNYKGTTPSKSIAPSKSIIVDPTITAIKLTFNKSVDGINSGFGWSASPSTSISSYTKAEFDVSGDVVYIYPRGLSIIQTRYLGYSVVSASDSTDTAFNIVDGEGFIVKDTLKKLKLIGTTLYPDKPDYAYVNGDGNTGINYLDDKMGSVNYKINDKSIDFIFDNDFPGGSLMFTIGLYQGNSIVRKWNVAGTGYINAVDSIAFYTINNVRTNKIAVYFNYDLEPDTLYNIQLTIYDNNDGNKGRIIFSTRANDGALGYGVGGVDDPSEFLYTDGRNYALYTYNGLPRGISFRTTPEPTP